MYNFDIDSLKWTMEKIYGININSLINKIEKNKIDVIIVDNYYVDINGNKYDIINQNIGKKI